MSNRFRISDLDAGGTVGRRETQPEGWRALLAVRRGDVPGFLRSLSFLLPAVTLIVLLLLSLLNTRYHHEQVMGSLESHVETSARQADAYLNDLSKLVEGAAERLADGGAEAPSTYLPNAEQIRVIPFTSLGIADRNNKALEALRHLERDLLRRAVEQQQLILDAFGGDNGWQLHFAQAIDPGRVLLATFSVSALQAGLSRSANPEVIKTELLYRQHGGWKSLASRGQASASGAQAEMLLRDAWLVRVTMDESRYQTLTRRNLPLYTVAVIALLATFSQFIIGLLQLQLQRRSAQREAEARARAAAQADAHQDKLIRAAFDHREQEDEPVLELNSGSFDEVLDSLDLSDDLDDSDAFIGGVTTAVEVEDTIFRAYDIRGIADLELTSDVCREIGKALGSELIEQKQRVTLVARDGRNSSPRIRDALVEGLRWSGVAVVDLGAVPTPVMQFATRELGIGNGLMVTGSHNGREYNGIKMVIRGSSLTEEAIFGLRERIRAQSYIEAAVPGEYSNRSIVDEYIDRIKSDVVVARRLKVVVDAANGVTGPVAPRVFQALGCMVEPLFCELDGDFPNHEPDPTRPGNLSALQAAVKAKRADLGIALDGDGDRVVFVTGEGDTVYPDQALMLLAQDVIARNPGAPVVYDVKCSSHLPRMINEAGGLPIMCRSGHSYVKNQIQESGALLGGEFTGHIFFRERWYGFDDGMYVAARMLEFLSLSAMRLHEHVERLPQSVVTPELSVPSDEVQKFVIIEQLKSTNFFEGAEVSTLDGLRVEYPHGWGLVRASNTGPALSLRFEADNAGQLANIQARFRDALRAVDPTLALDF
ncbi:phosphomannomutase/phosphoglucomutase [Litorivivens lipolytica]|uniref:phosphomannomutase n=1 Tax=Litorivivens lipolytica TaxID=1524264 RepID=A0A7W4W8H3_9GAMM|nr:phosphomannomutase/phosphoglucomutase [Litorivivens lipolytica]MBB3048762.1 phosphomannomutase/phosphoglucomutase [Litorivivens lipolytica]